MPDQISWKTLYHEPALYKAAIRLYTTPLFQKSKAQVVSSDQKNFYEFARHGLRHLEALHQALIKEKFHFRQGLAKDYCFNGRERTLYIYPWEERLVDLLLYRLLNQAFKKIFSPSSYAYRVEGFGVDRCQKRVAQTLSLMEKPIYIVKRDIVDYFGSISHDILFRQLEALIDKSDYLFALLQERIRFSYLKQGAWTVARRGVPFGTSIACFLANLYLSDLDRRMDETADIHYFRYADDLLLFSANLDSVRSAEVVMHSEFERLQLKSKSSHELNLIFSDQEALVPGFVRSGKIRHLGLEFRCDDSIGLSRDKFRKIMNIFKYALRRNERHWVKVKNPEEKAQAMIHVINKALKEGVRNVAIIDYYLKHVSDEKQLERLDLWLTEKVLALCFGGGHKKGLFRKISYKKLRRMGLPSLQHRARLLKHGHVKSPFLMWKNDSFLEGSEGTAAKSSLATIFSPTPEAVAI